MESSNTYCWQEGTRFKADPNLVGAALADLARRLGRPYEGLTPQDVKEEARRNPQSVLHRLFDWNDTSAAEKFRDDQARLILRSCRLIIRCEGGERTVITRVSVRTEKQNLYVPTHAAAKNEFLRDQMIASARAGLEGWRSRYQQLDGFEDLAPLVEQLLDGIEALKAKAKKKAKARKTPSLAATA